MPPEAVLRRALGLLCVVFGVAHLAPVAFVWLSSLGPAPVAVSARAWSLFFYGHFIAFVVCGYGWQAAAAARSKLFFGGPMIDFTLGVAGFMLLASLGGLAAHGGRLSWLALLPGLALAVFGLRLASGTALLSGGAPPAP